MDEWVPRTGVVIGEIPNYDIPDLFTVKIFHGGRIVNNKYVGGRIDYFDNCDKDKMSVTELDAMVRCLGHSGMIDYWYSAGEYDDALTKLNSDNDVVDMCALVPYFRMIIIYFDHLDLHNDDHDAEWERFVFDEIMFSQVASSEVVTKKLPEEPKKTTPSNERKKAIGIVIRELGCHDMASTQGSKASTLKPGDKGKKKVVEANAFSENDIHASMLEELVNGDVRKSKNGSKVASPHVEADGETDYGDFIDPGFVDDHYVVDDDWIPEMDMEMVNEINEVVEQVGPNSLMSSAHHFFNEADLAGIEDNEQMFGAIDPDNEILGHAINSDDEAEDKYPEFNPKTDMKNPKFVKGMKFATSDIFRATVRERGILDGWEGLFVRSDRTRVRIICKATDCPYEIFASKMQHENTLQVKTYNPEHNCDRVYENCMVKATYLSERFLDRIELNENWSTDSLARTMASDVRAAVSTQKAYRAKRMALKVLEGTVNAQYARVWDYGEELKKRDPNTTIDIKCDYNNPKKLPLFKRMYICLGACKNGFKSGCRELIGLDGCHLKSCYGGQLLIAVGLDANNTTWVIAYAMVEMKCKDAWIWFLELLVKDVNIRNDGAGWTFISDKQKGLIPAFEQVIPRAEHRFCVRHLWTNFNKLFQGMELKNQLWACARATTMVYFIKDMILMKNMCPAAHDWLSHPDRPPKNWSRSHFNTHLKCDILVNNICESFNSFILPARGKPIISMFEEIRMKLMKRIQIRRDKMMKYEGNICPKPREILDKNKVKAATDCISRLSGGPLVEVESIGGGQYVVHLENRTCTCRLWDLSGIPCKHAISAIHHKRHKPEDYVDNCYPKSTYMQIYDNIILPINGMDLWEVSDQAQILPPQYNRQPGRPRTKRIKDASEKVENSSFKLGRVQRSLKCSNCHVLGHNIKSCHRHLPPKEKTSKKVSKKRKLNSGEASTSATQSQKNVGPQKASVIRKNKLREKAKERAQKAKERRDEIKASGTKASSIASIKTAKAAAKASKSSKPSQTSTTSKAATSSKVSTSVKAATPTRASARIRKVPKNVN